MASRTRLRSSSFALAATLAGSFGAYHLTGYKDPGCPDFETVLDLSAKHVLAETVIGATDGLLSTGWGNPAIEDRVDRIREDGMRSHNPAYDPLREEAFEQAVRGEWSEEGLTAYLVALEMGGNEIYPLALAVMAEGQEGDLSAIHSVIQTRMEGPFEPVSFENWTFALARLIQIEIGAHELARGMSAFDIMMADPPIDIEALNRIGLEHLPSGFQADPVLLHDSDGIDLL